MYHLDEIVDVDKVGEIKSIELYQGDELIKSLDIRSRELMTSYQIMYMK